ncbi:MAG: YraN family protein [Phycisphaerae bacterium]|nr:YraN family protein [Phycisphaerae bacterium]
MRDARFRALTILADGLRRCLASVLPSRATPHDRGERAAAASLRREGWEIVATNVRYGRDEGDLVGRDPQGHPVLLEVKSSRDCLIAPERLVGARKQAALSRLAQRLARDRRFAFDGQVPRIDVVVVRLGATDREDRIERHLHGAVGARGPRVSANTGRTR